MHDDRQPLHSELRNGLTQLGVDAAPTALDKLLAYIQLLSKWNRVYNLTAVTDQKRMLTHHLLDSVSIMPALHGRDIVDVGAGAGLPGIPLAILCQERHFVELESNAKKARFMQQVVVELELANVEIVCQRAERFSSVRNPEFTATLGEGVNSASEAGYHGVDDNFNPTQTSFGGFDTVVSRAFASLAEMLAVAGHLCRKSGLILAMKGKMPKSELNCLPRGYFCDKVDNLAVPGLEAERHLVHIKPRA